MKTIRKIMFIIILISVICTVSWAQSKALPKTAKLLPPETVFLVDIENFSQLEKQFEKTDVYSLYKDPAMAAFVEDVRTNWREKVRELDNEVAAAIVDANVLPEGRMALALVLNEQTTEANEPPFLFIAQWGAKISKIKEAVDEMAREAVEGGAHRRRENYRGVNIETIIGEKSSVLSYCVIDDCLITSVNTESLEFVIAHIKGATSPTLADDGDYTAAIATVGPYHDIDFYVNIKQIIKTTIAQDTMGSARTYISNLGVDNVAGLSCSIGLGRGAGSSSSAKIFVKVNGAKKGICKLLDAESAVLRAPRFIPASAYSVTFFNLNIKKAYNELYNILYSFNPKAAAIMNTPLLPPTSPEGEPQLLLKSGIVDHLGSQIIIAQRIKKPFSKVSAPTESFFALAVDDRSALERSLSLLHSRIFAAGDPDARRELLGHTIYVVDLSAMMPLFMPAEVTPMQAPVGATLPQMPKYAFTFTDTHLIVGLESIVEQAVRTLSSDLSVSVASAKWFTETKSAIPSMVGVAGLEDNEASGELFWWIMKQVSEKAKSKDSSMQVGISLAPNPGMIFSQAGFDLFNFSLLPEFNAVRKYFGLSAFYGLSRPDGFFFEFKNLNPPSAD